MKRPLLITILISLSASAEVPSGAVQFSLKWISDGDTIVTTGDNRIRLWGIDTPERDQRYGADATEALTEMLRNEQLYLETKDIDRYGRTVGVIYTTNGSEINLEMVCKGHAWWYQRYAPEASHYEQCQDGAKDSRLGLWAEEDPVAPWNWRRR
jgi:endonuclease YncB( thermonuclease family)